MFELSTKDLLSYKPKKNTVIMLGLDKCSVCTEYIPKVSEVVKGAKALGLYVKYDESVKDYYANLTDNAPLILPQLFIFNSEGFLGVIEATNTDGLKMILDQI